MLTLTDRDCVDLAVEQVNKAIIEAYHANCPEKKSGTNWKHSLVKQVSRSSQEPSAQAI